ncbi:MAG: sulfatase-like hydrolase/transferase [Verrucomicrobiae bacterium]|nr:sulfatase-like hydrolase/transferase [Verrucomicrobiae bacterium]
MAKAGQPNVVILFTDDQGTLDARCYGSKDLITPNIDRLAANGVRFTRAYAHTVCCPSRAALLTGRYPQRAGIVHWTQGDMHSKQGINMPLEEVTLAEALKPAGYRTALFGKWHLGAHRDFGPEKQGFDEFFGIRGGFIDNYKHHALHQNGFFDLYDGTQPVYVPGKYFPELMVQRSMNFIDQNKNHPFFLYVAFNIPHYPEQALKKHQAFYREMKDPARRSHGAIITTTDHYIGQIISKLEEHHLLENTIVIFMSDNGHSEETRYRIRGDHHKSGYPRGHFYGASGGGNTGKWIGHKGTFLEGGIRVPAIIRFPAALPRGQVCDRIITAMDWFPTVLHLCGVEQPEDAPELDGHSLISLIKNPDTPSHYKTLHFAWGNQWAVREGDWKLIGNDRKRSLSLHNLADPRPEVKDHAQEQPDKVKALQRLHRQWADKVEMQP